MFISFFFKQKTAYEMRISDWSSDVCSSDLQRLVFPGPRAVVLVLVVAGQRRHQQALAAIRAQAHVDVVQPPGGGHGAEQGNDLLRQPREPAPRVQRARAPRLRGGRGSEGRRVGKERVSQGKSRWSPDT